MHLKRLYGKGIARRVPAQELSTRICATLGQLSLKKLTFAFGPGQCRPISSLTSAPPCAINVF